MSADIEAIDFELCWCGTSRRVLSQSPLRLAACPTCAWRESQAQAERRELARAVAEELRTLHPSDPKPHLTWREVMVMLRENPDASGARQRIYRLAKDDRIERLSDDERRAAGLPRGAYYTRVSVERHLRRVRKLCGDSGKRTDGDVPVAPLSRAEPAGASVPPLAAAAGVASYARALAARKRSTD